jgi:hypothetical protein
MRADTERERRRRELGWMNVNYHLALVLDVWKVKLRKKASRDWIGEANGDAV